MREIDKQRNDNKQTNTAKKMNLQCCGNNGGRVMNEHKFSRKSAVYDSILGSMTSMSKHLLENRLCSWEDSKYISSKSGDIS